MVEIWIAVKLVVLFWLKLLFNNHYNLLNTELHFKKIMKSVLLRQEGHTIKSKTKWNTEKLKNALLWTFTMCSPTLK